MTPGFEISRTDTFMEMESRLVVPGAEDGPDMESDCLMDVGLPLGVMRVSETR